MKINNDKKGKLNEHAFNGQKHAGSFLFELHRMQMSRRWSAYNCAWHQTVRCWKCQPYELETMLRHCCWSIVNADICTLALVQWWTLNRCHQFDLHRCHCHCHQDHNHHPANRCACCHHLRLHLGRCFLDYWWYCYDFLAARLFVSIRFVMDCVVGMSMTDLKLYEKSKFDKKFQ